LQRYHKKEASLNLHPFLKKKLGKVPDAELARLFTTSPAQVARWRYSLGILTPARRRIVLPKAIMSKLGLIPDALLAKKFRVSVTVIAIRRKELGIAATKNQKRYPWSKRSLLLLGTRSDPSIARELQVPVHTVRWKRMTLGISPAHANRQSLSWTKPMLALLGKSPDVKLAKRLGLARETVSTKRRSLGILPVGSQRRAIWSPKMLQDIKTLRPKEFAEKYGFSRSAVSQKRKKLGLPIADRGVNWSNSMLQKLGKVSDGQLAAQMSISRKAVCAKRLQLGVPSIVARSSFKWASAEVALLGTMPDNKLAAQLGLAWPQIPFEMLAVDAELTPLSSNACRGACRVSLFSVSEFENFCVQSAQYQDRRLQMLLGRELVNGSWFPRRAKPGANTSLM
jgi:hypothetical protein